LLKLKTKGPERKAGPVQPTSRQQISAKDWAT
jgi:hypothetical protein